jgi:energy coupling factor transporter S component ThiW
MKTKQLTLSALFTAIGVIAGSMIYIPVGISKCFPIQSSINVVSAVVLGPYYGTAIAFCISLIRNIIGTGSILAFPGSMIGAFLAGIIFYKTKNVLAAVAAEMFGTGILGGLLAFPIANLIMGTEVAALFFIPPFLISAIGGSIIAYCLVKILHSSKILILIKKKPKFRI